MLSLKDSLQNSKSNKALSLVNGIPASGAGNNNDRDEYTRQVVAVGGSPPISFGGVGVDALPGDSDVDVGGGAYLDIIANVVTSVGLATKCPGYFTVGQCKNGHRFAKELYCGREWCPVCGKDKSPAHMRRFARWVGRAQQIQSIGYLVFTLPEEVRSRYRSKARLNELTKRVTGGDKSRRIEGMLKGMGFGRGLSRWHWFGETPGKWHPHLNVIIESGHLTPGQLQGIRRAYAGILGVKVAVVNYSYTKVVPKMLHILKYVTRATFRDYTWDKSMAAELYNFRNMRAWGKWDNPAVWELKGKSQLEPIAKLESGLCPKCGEPLSWTRAGDIAWLKLWIAAGQAASIGAGYWELAET